MTTSTAAARLLFAIIIASSTTLRSESMRPAPENKSNAQHDQAPSGQARSGQSFDFNKNQWLINAAAGQYRRHVVHTDGIEKQIVEGTWKSPQQGDNVSTPDGGSQPWRATSADENGWIDTQSMRSGYVFTSIDADRDARLILDASGHSLVYVNGRPCAGDPYATGWNRVPIRLKKGRNTFLFHFRRGRLRAKLETPPADLFLNTRDTTLPDLIRRSGDERDVDMDMLWGALPVVNATPDRMCNLWIEATLESVSTEGTNLEDGDKPAKRFSIKTPLLPMTPMSAHKAPFRMVSHDGISGDTAALILRLLHVPTGEGETRLLDTQRLEIRVRSHEQKHKRTFVSGIDGSIQYFAVTPAQGDDGHPPDHSQKRDGQEHKEPEQKALVLTLHGAGVEASGQAAAYAPKSWAHIVAPTNRRPFGFDWEDWGRWDALEVLEIAEREFETDPRRTYLTGHSMGGHGTWHVGTLFPDRFAAIAPSAGWISFQSYTGGSSAQQEGDLDRLLDQAAAGSDTLARKHNLARLGVYLLHGDADDNVPVSEARAMRSVLGEFHPDFAYHEQPGAGHWWGNQCVDWPPLFQFLKSRRIEPAHQQDHVRFTTPSPAVSDSCFWVTIETQQHSMQPSTVDLRKTDNPAAVTGTTTNVTRLRIDLSRAGLLQTPSDEKTLAVELNGKPVSVVVEEADRNEVCLLFDGEEWKQSTPAPATEKNPKRYGPFKEAFNRQFLFVYGTKGTPEQNRWSLDRVRLDAERFWYRGNGAVEVRPDSEFDLESTRDRSVILYGNRDSNAAFDLLLPESPIHVSDGYVNVGERTFRGEDLACLFVRPRPDSDVALVGVVGGTGTTGMRLSDRLPIFVSGAGFPDFLVLHTDMLTQGLPGILAAGFFGPDWKISDDNVVVAD